MADEICIFKRIEKKYRITSEQKKMLLDEIGGYLIPDAHGKSTICSLYLDTPDFLLIRNSIDAKAYKEKIRLRSYGTPQPDSKVFLELKKKYKGIVYKRRIAMTLKAAENYIHNGEKPVESQIMSEMDYAMKFYHEPNPAMMIVYEREAYYVKELPNVRVTFDSSIRYRRTSLQLSKGKDGKKIIPDNELVMEIKTDGAMPLWLSHALDKCNIRPASFSKYGTAYRDALACSADGYKGEYNNVNVV